MRKTRYGLLGFLLFSASLMTGQNHFSATYNTALPLGKTRDFISKYSLRGFGVEAGSRLNAKISLGLGFGWNGFYEELGYDQYGPEDGLPENLNIWSQAWNYTTIHPITGNVKYHKRLIRGFDTYAGAGIGLSKIARVTDFGVYSLIQRSWHLTIAPEAGISYMITKHIGVIFNTRFTWCSRAEEVDSQSYLGFNIGLTVR